MMNCILCAMIIRMAHRYTESQDAQHRHISFVGSNKGTFSETWYAYSDTVK